MSIPILLVLLILTLKICNGQIIPKDSLYLCQIPPNNIPKEFKLKVSQGFKALERIAISKDGRMIFYDENNGYHKNSSNTLNYYRYDKDKWTGPFVLAENFSSPALSLTEDTLFTSKGFLINNKGIWSAPFRYNSKNESLHYLQVTNSGTYYAATKNPLTNNKKRDWSKIVFSNKDTVITSLGTPINSSNDNLDFCISRDESFIIISSDRIDLTKHGYLDLYVSFRKKDNSWTIPQNLGNSINDSTEARWGPFITSDNKYLFYSRAFKRDYSDACTNWVRIDNIVDSLKRTNKEIKE